MGFRYYKYRLIYSITLVRVSTLYPIFRDQKLVDDISFKKNTNYDNLSSKFELKQYENILLKDLVEEITIDINNHISSLR